jgi:hypothetical protein
MRQRLRAGSRSRESTRPGVLIVADHPVTINFSSPVIRSRTKSSLLPFRYARHTISLARARGEKLITAMLSCRTLDEAAKQAGISRKTLYSVRQDAQFMARYQRALDEMLESAVNQLRSNAVHATEVLRKIAADENQHGNARVRASEVTLTTLLKATELQDILRRLEALEKAVGEAGNAPA